MNSLFSFGWGQIGQFLLGLALVASFMQTLLPFVGGYARQNRLQFLMPLGARFALIQTIALAGAFFILMALFIRSDFSYRVVFENSHSLQPLIYQISGVWGNHEGSMLLWILILAFCGVLISLFGSHLPPSLKFKTIAVQGLVGFGFLLFIIFTSNPFDRLLPAPIEGNSLNPLLQDPGLIFHPPLLYIGYVGISVVFSFAIAALIEGRVDPAWASWIRPWTLFAWGFLTAGIGLGSWWAYYELGWGGFWFWDPVENASFMPWLAATALLHSAIVAEKREALKAWTIFLAILAFSFSLLGTFIVRSGLLTSVHAFANDPSRGFFILILMLLAVGGGFLCFALRSSHLKSSALFSPISREGMLLVNNLLLSVALVAVLVGTLYPVLLETVTGERISVGPPFFNLTFVPLVIPLLILLGFGPMLPWKRGKIRNVLSKLRLAMLITLIFFVAFLAYFYERAPMAVIGMTLGVWLICGGLTDLWSRVSLHKRSWIEKLQSLFRLRLSVWGMSCAHIGVGIVVMGVTGTSLLTIEAKSIMAVGDQMAFNGGTILLESLEVSPGPNYQSLFAHLNYINDQGEKILVLSPERRSYISGGQQTTEADIHSTLGYDIYATMTETQQSNQVSVTIFYKPLAPWLWIGGLLMVLGAVFSLSDRRMRIAEAGRVKNKPQSVEKIRV